MSGIVQFAKDRKTRKRAKEFVRHVTHLRNMQQDLMSEVDIQGCRDREADLRAALKSRDVPQIQECRKALLDYAGPRFKESRFPGISENIEIMAVAIAVAMACRTYFIQPFKIPTGSMQPTLYGIQQESREGPSIMDRMPLKLAKWMWSGAWYREVRVSKAGKVWQDPSFPYDGKNVTFFVGQKRYTVPANGVMRQLQEGQFLSKGAVLWRGQRVAGDHVFVDKVRWNFGRPQRGQIMVFSTEGIESLQQGTHYIKRMVGLPNETIAIDPPFLRIDGELVRTPDSIRRISEKEAPHSQGYSLVHPQQTRDATPDAVMNHPGKTFDLGKGEYYALGDNTGNSKDSRYWGAVPEQNLVGPAFMVYWPFSSRWGLKD